MHPIELTSAPSIQGENSLLYLVLSLGSPGDKHFSWSSPVQSICCCPVISHFVSISVFREYSLSLVLYGHREDSFLWGLHFFCLSFLSGTVGRTWKLHSSSFFFSLLSFFFFFACFVFLTNAGHCLLGISLEIFLKTWI